MFKTLLIVLLIAVWLNRTIQIAEFGKKINYFDSWFRYQIVQLITTKLYESKQASIFKYFNKENHWLKINKRPKLSNCSLARAP